LVVQFKYPLRWVGLAHGDELGMGFGELLENCIEHGAKVREV